MSKLTTSTKETNSTKPKKPQTKKQKKTSLNYPNLCRGLSGIQHASWYIPKEILAEAKVSRKELEELASRIISASADLSHNMILCPACKKRLTNRKFSKLNKQRFEGTCDICEEHSIWTQGEYNFLVGATRLKYTLKEAKAIMREKYPEYCI